MDLVEEFLELGKDVAYQHLLQKHDINDPYILGITNLDKCFTAVTNEVSVQTLIEFFRVLRRRIPGRHLPNLDLMIREPTLGVKPVLYMST